MPVISSWSAPFNGGTITTPLGVSPTTTDTPLVVTGSAGSIDANTQLQEWKAGGATVMSLGARGGIFLVEGASGQALEIDLNTAGQGIVIYDPSFAALLQITKVGLGFFGATPAAKPAVTGALSTVIDPAAKAVLTSLLAALVTLGLATNSTT